MKVVDYVLYFYLLCFLLAVHYVAGRIVSIVGGLSGLLLDAFGIVYNVCGCVASVPSTFSKVLSLIRRLDVLWYEDTVA